jgi:hypothetical protein
MIGTVEHIPYAMTKPDSGTRHASLRVLTLALVIGESCV